MQYKYMSDYEMLTWIIGAKEVDRLYHGQLSPLFRPRRNPCRALHRLSIARELVRRSLLETMHYNSVFNNPAVVKEYLLATLSDLEHESFLVLFLDSQHRLIAEEELARGSISSAPVYPREIVKRALEHNAAALLFVHNHPSGVAEPSEADRRLTQLLKQAVSLIEVNVLDHFVIGKGTMIGFAERGWL